MAVRGTVNADGTSTRSGGDLERALNFTNSSLGMPETKDAIYGAFGDILNLEEEESVPYTYNVYQSQAQNIDNPDTMQYSYGTGSQPVFQWVRSIQTGQRTYDPNSQFDNDILDEYKKMFNDGAVPPNALTPDEIMKQAGRDLVTSVASQAGGQVGSALVDPYYDGLSTLGRAGKGLGNTFSLNPTDSASRLAGQAGDLSPLGDDLTILPSFSTESAASNVGQANLETFKSLKDSGELTNVGTVKNPVYAMSKTTASNLNEMSLKGTNDPIALREGGYGSIKTDPTQQITAGNQAVSELSYAGGVKNRLDWSTPEGASNFSSAAGAAGTNFLVSLAMGAKPKQAAKQAAGGFVGRTIGTALLTPVLGPLAPIVGGTIGSMLAGRVICNELCKQGLIDRKMLLNDYKFTRDYLTPQYVNGYHVWAVWMVKQLRKKRFVDFWQHIVVHRGNEIAYIYGETNKPDYLGKLYRKIFEPVCWVLGAFCKKTDWSVLYQKKEI